MRSFFTALAFLIILFAVIPAVRRSIDTDPAGKSAHSEDRDEG